MCWPAVKFEVAEHDQTDPLEASRRHPESMATGGVTHHNGKASAVVEASGREYSQALGPDAPAAVALRHALNTGLERLRQNDPGARRGDVEGVHRMRTASRRLRSELRLYGDLLDDDRSGPVGQELQWLGRRLGAVRDADVMSGRLRESAGELAVELDPLFQALARRHDEASAALRETLESERYNRLLDWLAHAAADSCLSASAEEPCSGTLPALARRIWKRLRKAGRALDLSAPDEAYHEVRKRAKRARYSVESIAPALASDSADAARRFARQANIVQDVLGEHQDATVACKEIGRIAAEINGESAFHLAAGRLFERQAIAAMAARTRFFKVWQKLDRKKNVRWMKA
jgi:CHAD domain-containing protein